MSRYRPPRPHRSISARLAARLAWLGLAGMVLLGLAVGSVGAYRLSVQLERKALERQEVSMRVAWAVLEAVGRPFRVADGVMLAGERPLNGNQEVIDRIHALVGGTATVFLGDRRIATNVPGPDGGPALGTRLAPGPVHDAVLRDGRPWRGEADILGQAYLTAYDPIRDAEGSVIGVLYVGVPRAAFFAAMEELILDIATASLLAAAVLAGLIAWLGYALVQRLLRPMRAIEAAMVRLAQDDPDVVIPALDRADEVGSMARAVAVFHGHVVERLRRRAEQDAAEAEAEARRREAMQSIADSLEESVRVLVGAVEGIGTADAAPPALAATAAPPAPALADPAPPDRARAAEDENAKARFLALMSHELRTPLNAILGFSELIRDQSYGPSDPAHYIDYAREIHASGEQLLQVINDILEVSRLESGQSGIAPVPIDLPAVLAAQLRRVAARAEERGQSLRLDIADPPPSLRADERAVRLAVFNLLSNAVKFTPAGGSIALRCAPDEDHAVEIVVADTGIGIPAGQIGRVLLPFERAGGIYTVAQNGAGLGLALVKKLMDLHGGEIRIDSAEGIGTSVTLRFPPQPGSAPTEPPPGG